MNESLRPPIRVPRQLFDGVPPQAAIEARAIVALEAILADDFQHPDYEHPTGEVVTAFLLAKGMRAG